LRGGYVINISNISIFEINNKEEFCFIYFEAEIDGIIKFQDSIKTFQTIYSTESAKEEVKRYLSNKYNAI
jgi:hypothetical protein